MSFPQVQSITATTFASDTTAHAVNMPATVNTGDLLLTLFVHDGSATVTTPSGWTLISYTNDTVSGFGVYAKDASGSEDGTTVGYVTSAAEKAVAQVYRITSWYGTVSTGVEATATNGSGSNNPNPSTLNPTNWDVQETLWIATFGASSPGLTTVSAYPTNYTNGTFTSSGSADGSYAQMASARRENNVASENPGTFTNDATSEKYWIAYTIAIRPEFISQTIEPPLLTNTPTFYGAELALAGLLIPPLLTNEPTFYSLSLAYEQILLPELLTNTPTFYGPAMAYTIGVPLLENTPTFYGPEIINTQVLVAPLLTNTPTFYGPEFRGPRNIGAPLLTNTPTFYGPTVFSLWSDTNDLTSGTWSDVDIPQ